MGCSRSHPLPPGIFVEMPSPPPEWYANAEIITTSNAFDEWTDKELDDEISRLQKRVKELETEKIKKRLDRTLAWDDDNIMHDPDVRKMVENGEHICHMFDAPCEACEDDEEDSDDEVRVLTEEEVQNDPEMTQSAAIRHAGQLRAHFC